MPVAYNNSKFKCQLYSEYSILKLTFLKKLVQNPEFMNNSENINSIGRYGVGDITDFYTVY